jgi:DNA-binding transcriptional LysR family regulator
MLDLRRLRVLREVAVRGSFSAAAEALHVSQSAVSQQIATLEAEAGAPLLVRLRGGPVLTDAGELLVGHADAAIARLEQAERELAELAGLGGGSLRMVSFPSAGATLMPAAAAEFRNRHPEVHLSMSEGDPEDAIPALRRGAHDLAVVYDFELEPLPEDRDLDLRPLLVERMHVALPLEHPLAGEPALRLEQLAGDSWLCGTTDGSCRALTINSCRNAGFEPEVSFESNDYNVMQSLVAAGMGVTLVPDLALASLNPGVRIVPVAPRPPLRRVWAVSLAAGARSAATAAMVEVLEQVGAAFGERAPALAAA